MSRRTKTLLTGLVTGAILGAVCALVINDVEEDGELGLNALGPMQYYQIGIAVLGLARQFGGMLRYSEDE